MDTKKLIRLLNSWSDGPKVLVAHEDSPKDVAELAMFVGSNTEIIEWCKRFKGKNTVIYVAGPLNLVYGLKQIQPNANIWHIDDENI